jgi:hypothetical protein
MKISFEEIYRHIGLLLYALAADDDGLTPDKVLKLTAIV